SSTKKPAHLLNMHPELILRPSIPGEMGVSHRDIPGPCSAKASLRAGHAARIKTAPALHLDPSVERADEAGCCTLARNHQWFEAFGRLSVALPRERAHELGQPSAAIAATMGKARLLGLLVDRKEHGAPGEFAPTLTAAEVLERAREELGDAAADALDVALRS